MGAGRRQPPAGPNPSPPPNSTLSLQDRYPYFSTAALAPSNKFYKADELNACGQCFQIQCKDGRGGAGRGAGERMGVWRREGGKAGILWTACRPPSALRPPLRLVLIPAPSPPAPAGVCKTDAAGKPLSILVMISDE